MNDTYATARADAILNLLIQHQPNLVAEKTLVDSQDGQRLAQAIAKLRLELIEQLKQQS